jgi:formylglycine-generating enzyme required for sulfatase activity
MPYFHVLVDHHPANYPEVGMVDDRDWSPFYPGKLSSQWRKQYTTQLYLLSGFLNLNVGVFGIGALSAIIGLMLFSSPLSAKFNAVAISPTPSLVAGTERTDNFGIVQLYVPAGCFMMGSDPRQDPNTLTDEQPQHQVCFTNGYWLDKFDVTNAAFAAFVKAGGYNNDSLWSTDGLNWKQSKKISGPDITCTQFSNQPNQPRVCVNYYEAEAYANWRGGKLPTEAEWEYAARGTEDLIYPWGNTFVQSKTNTAKAGHAKTTAVNTYPAGKSWIGAYDMVGNVWQWVRDWYDSNYYSSSPDIDPTGPITGKSRSLRGGSWIDTSDSVRTAFRGLGRYPDDQYPYIGFRLVTDTNSPAIPIPSTPTPS